MCGRYTYTEALDPVSVILPEDEIPISLGPRYNIAPSQYCPVIPQRDPDYIHFFRWGLLPFWAKDMSIGYKMINARAETLMEKTSFKKPLQTSRCLVLGDGFYEWKKTKNQKQPYRITLTSGKAFYFAGLTEKWKSPEGKTIYSFTIITTEPNLIVAPLHNRMPVILQPESIDLWMDPDADILDVLSLLRPYPDEFIMAYPVSSDVGSPRNDYKKLIEPVDPII